MISGLLKDKITFLKCVILNDEYGSEKREWEEVIKTKASKQINSGNRIIEDYEVINTYTLTFEIRMYHKVDESMRIKHNGSLFNILSIEEDRQKQKKIIKCSKINE